VAKIIDSETPATALRTFVAHLSDTTLRAVRRKAFTARYDAGFERPGAHVRRPFIIASCTGAALLALYSCSMHAALTTDGSGHVVGVSALRVESSFPRLVVAMLVAGGQLAIELRWTRSLGERMSASAPSHKASTRASVPL
jgi:hypothetical protein